jgi:hypothetical protein
VAARHLPDGVDHRGDDEAEGERDAEQISARYGRRRLARQDQRRHDGSGTDQHQQRGAERLGDGALRQRMLLHVTSPQWSMHIR